MRRSLMLCSAALVVCATVIAGEVVMRGEAIPADAEAIAIDDVLKDPSRFDEPVVVEGVVESVCQNRGCWMQVTSAAGKPGVRVTFKDYGFFVPKDSMGWQARLQGLVETKTLSKENADHLEGEGVKLSRNPDGTATEVSFVASGVELHQPRS